MSAANAAQNLRAARVALESYRAAHVKDDADQYQWMPTALLRDAAQTFLDAGDAEEAVKALDVVLDIDPLDASLLLGHLRATRVRATFRDNRPWTLVPAARPVVAHEIARIEPDLLTARGGSDQQLTLALWAVSYAGSAQLADAALRRARGLVAQSWPAGVPRLVPGARYSVTGQGYLCRDGEPEPTPAKVWVEGHHACALAAAYSYLRLVHACRFGFPRTLAVEEGPRFGKDRPDGWPAYIDGMSTMEVTTFCSTMPGLCRSVFKHFLPLFYDEARGREFNWPVGDEFLHRRPGELDQHEYVCSAEFLLRDCADRYFDARMAELASAGWTGRGTTLVTTHLALERIAKVRSLHELVLPLAGQLGEPSRRMLAELDKLCREIVRMEVPERQPHGRRLVAYPCYYDGSDPAAAPLDPLIEACLERRAPFLAASYGEYSRATSRLDDRRTVLPYWTPWAGLPFHGVYSQPAF